MHRFVKTLDWSLQGQGHAWSILYVFLTTIFPPTHDTFCPQNPQTFRMVRSKLLTISHFQNKARTGVSNTNLLAEQKSKREENLELFDHGRPNFFKSSMD